MVEKQLGDSPRVPICMALDYECFVGAHATGGQNESELQKDISKEKGN